MIKTDLDVKLMDEGRLKISQMESDEVKVVTENGEVNSRGLKSHNIHIITENGHITSDGSMQGNIFINANNTVILSLVSFMLIRSFVCDVFSTFSFIFYTP